MIPRNRPAQTKQQNPHRSKSGQGAYFPQNSLPVRTGGDVLTHRRLCGELARKWHRWTVCSTAGKNFRDITRLLDNASTTHRGRCQRLSEIRARTPDIVPAFWRGSQWTSEGRTCARRSGRPGTKTLVLERHQNDYQSNIFSTATDSISHPLLQH